jgi:predicted ATPase
MPNRLNEQLIQLEWKQAGAVDTYFNAYQLSDGTLRFICLATLLLQPNLPQTIIIDEPELGLHPVAVNKLASLIKKASAKTQIIISTQSVNLVDNFEPQDIIVVDRKDNATVFDRLDAESLEVWLKDYSLGEIWEKNVIGGQPLI